MSLFFPLLSSSAILSPSFHSISSIPSVFLLPPRSPVRPSIPQTTKCSCLCRAFSPALPKQRVFYMFLMCHRLVWTRAPGVLYSRASAAEASSPPRSLFLILISIRFARTRRACGGPDKMLGLKATMVRSLCLSSVCLRAVPADPLLHLELALVSLSLCLSNVSMRGAHRASSTTRARWWPSALTC